MVFLGYDNTGKKKKQKYTGGITSNLKAFAQQKTNPPSLSTKPTIKCQGSLWNGRKYLQTIFPK